MAGMVRASASRIGTGVQAYLAGPTNLFGARSCRRVSSTSRTSYSISYVCVWLNV